MSAWDENYAAHWTAGIDSGCLLHVHRVALREKGVVPFLGFLLLSFLQVHACSSIRRERKRVGVVITCRLWDRQFWKLLKQNHWDHFVKTLSGSPVNALEEKIRSLITSLICCVSYAADCYLHHHTCVLLFYLLCIEQSASENSSVNKVMLRNISFFLSCFECRIHAKAKELSGESWQPAEQSQSDKAQKRCSGVPGMWKARYWAQWHCPLFS